MMDNAGKRRVTVGFRLDPVEIRVEAEAPSNELVSTVEAIVNEIKQGQEQIGEVVSQLDKSKFAPAKPSIQEATLPLERLAAKLGTKSEVLRNVFLIENQKVFLMVDKSKLRPRGAGEKAALIILYAYKYALDKRATYDEVNEAYEQLKLKPLTFGWRSKGNLLRAKEDFSVQD